MLNINNKIPRKVINKFKNKNDNPEHLESVKEYLTDSLRKMKKKQENLMKKHNFGNKENKYVLYPEKNAFYMYNSKTNNVFFKAKVQIIGTYVEKSKTWRWGWSNRFVPPELEKTALKIKKFGEANKMELLTKPKIRYDNLGLNFTALGMQLTNSPGFYIIPGTKVYPHVYLIFTKVEKVNLDYKKIISEVRTETRKNTLVLKNKLKTIKIKKDKPKEKKNTKLNKKTKKNNKSKTKVALHKNNNKFSKLIKLFRVK